jgi:hypothetical protein
MYELLLSPNSWPKNLGAAYTQANIVISFVCLPPLIIDFALVDELYETWYEHHATKGNPISHLCMLYFPAISNTNMEAVRTSEMGKILNVGSWNFVWENILESVHFLFGK